MNDDEPQKNVAGTARDLMFFAPPLEPRTALSLPMHFVCSRDDGQLVQMTISGKQYLLGEKIYDPEIACRFADMASLRFRKYRRGNPRWNFSEAQAIADTANTEENGGQLAVFLLTCLENKLRRAGMLVEITSTINTQPKQPRRTLEQRIAAIEQRITQLEQQSYDNKPEPGV